MIKIYDSLKEKNIPFKPIKKDEVSFYVCGPTVYGPGHVGHARTYIAFDIIRRYLEYKGYKVKYVMNITDVHDDIIKTAIRERTDIFSLGNKFSRLFLEDQESLGNKKATKNPRVTKHIKEIIKYIQELEKKGFAYESDDSVYFDVSKYKRYGKLSNIKIEQGKTGTRVDTDKYERKQASDFVLWKKSKEDEPSWLGPWGEGRPGWHIECSVMSKKYLGEQIDIHGGARDLKFPHHENELAQSEAIGKSPFVKYWMHGGLLKINGTKMSKSLNNYITIEDVLKKYDSRAIRMFVASSHYQSELNWSEKNLKQAEARLNRIDEFLLKLGEGKKISLLKYEKAITKTMDDNFNTPEALAVIFDLIKDINPKIGKVNKKEILTFFKKIDKIFNFLIKKEESIPQVINNLLKERESLRKEKEWEKADKLRIEIDKLGYIVEDSDSGSQLVKK